VHRADDMGVHKKLRSGEPIDSAWREGGKRTVDIGALAGEIQKKRPAQTFSAAEFASEMIEGAEKVRFCAIKRKSGPNNSEESHRART
jgi:hypothetical protein